MKVKSQAIETAPCSKCKELHRTIDMYWTRRDGYLCPKCHRDMRAARQRVERRSRRGGA